VIRSEGLPIDGQRALAGGTGASEVAEVIEHAAEVVHADGDVRVIRSESLLNTQAIEIAILPKCPPRSIRANASAVRSSGST
jgi:hypothetical protein